MHRAHTEDRINLLSSRLNDLSLVVSDSTQPPHTLLSLILSIPEAIVHVVQSVFELPGLVFKRVIRVILGGSVKARSNGKVDTLNNKGKTVKGTRSPTKKRLP